MDLEGIASLLQSGFSLQETLTLLEDKQNRKTFHWIKQRLKSGIPLSRFFPALCPKRISALLSGFLNVLDLTQALTLSLKIENQIAEQQKEYLNGLIYPCLLFPITILGILLFNEFCFPTLLNMLTSFQVTIDDYLSLQTWLRIFTDVSISASLIISLGLFIIKLCHKEIGTYCLLQKIWPKNLYSQYVSVRFVYFYLSAIENHLSTREALTILQSLTKQKMIVFLANTIETGLLKGETFEKSLAIPWLDPLLCRFFQIGFYADSMERLLKAYLSQAKVRNRQACKKITKTVQLISYGTIGLLLVLVYQVLLLPMQILTQL